MSLSLFHGSEQNLNRKGNGHVQTGPTNAGRVQKHTRKRALKRAGGGPRYDSRPDKYGNVQKGGTKVEGVQILNVMFRICYNKKMLRSLVRLRCRLGILRSCDVWARAFRASNSCRLSWGKAVVSSEAAGVFSSSITCKSLPLELLKILCGWRKSRFHWRRNRAKLMVKVNSESVIEDVCFLKRIHHFLKLLIRCV